MPPQADGWTLEEAAALLDPPITVDELRALTIAARTQPAGQRRTGRRGRPVTVYDPADLMRAHAAVVRVWAHSLTIM